MSPDEESRLDEILSVELRDESLAEGLRERITAALRARRQERPVRPVVSLPQAAHDHPLLQWSEEILLLFGPFVSLLNYGKDTRLPSCR